MSDKKTVKVKTKAPTGLKIARSGHNFTASWKIGDKDYGEGQSFQYRVNKGKWNNVNIGKTTTKKNVSLDFTDYFPASGKKKLSNLQVRVKGKRKSYKGKKATYVPTASNWTTQTFDVETPKNPGTITVTLNEQLSNVCTFGWDAGSSDTDHKIFRDTEYQTMLVKDCKETNGSKLSWKSGKLGWATGAKGSSGSIEITEDTALLATGSYTRWVRVRSRGSNGASDWKNATYASHTFAIPCQAKITSATAKTVEAGGYLCTVKWTANANKSRPIDSTVVQYAFAVPDAGMTCPDGASWNDAKTIRDTAESDGASFSVDDTAGYDQCLFVRVNTHHDTEVTYGLPELADVGALKAPTNLSATAIDTQTYRSTVTATNNSDVIDSFLAVVYMTEANPTGYVVGIIPHGEPSVTVQLPTGASGGSFGVYAAVGSYSSVDMPDGSGCYNVTAKMKSAKVTTGGSIPAAPGDVTLSQTAVPGTIRVTFDWDWSSANAAEISWADHEDAWESTEEPETYVIQNTHAARWNISGLETGITWYVRVRLINRSGDEETYGAYSDIVSIDLSSAPAIPSLSLSDSVITQDGSVTASWVYVSTDGTAQAFAEVCEFADPSQVDEKYVLTADTVVHTYKTYYTRTGSGTTQNPYVYTAVSTPADNPATAGYYEENVRIIAQTETAQFVTISPAAVGWMTGESHSLAVRVVSASGRQSEGWSDPVPVIVADPLVIAIASTSLVQETITEDGVERTVNSLKAMPLSITVTGAGEGGTTTVIIERAQTYAMARPDESDLIGYEGETVALHTQTGEAQIVIDQDSEELYGFLDDEAPYRIIATVQDGLGQSAETSMDFEVHWTHQALIPDATVVSDQDNLVAIITPIAPEGVGPGDVCDIYRLSVDKPQLIYPNASFGAKYVDPFPTIGEHGGHRIVYKTVNGDYITANNELAWIDLVDEDGDYFDTPFNIIDFGSQRVRLQYNVDLSHQWKKDFKETKYLGGSVQGDWNPAVSRTGSLSSVAIASMDQETIEAIRRLADHPKICHVRTKDGSSYPADVQVSEAYHFSNGHKIVEFSMSITRVDPDGYDGLTLAEWQTTQGG